MPFSDYSASRHLKRDDIFGGRIDWLENEADKRNDNDEQIEKIEETATERVTM